MHEQYMDRFSAGDPLAAARLMTIVERGGAEAEAVLDRIFPDIGRAYRIGITGLTGAGKSSLINKLASHYRRTVDKIGIVAVDPSSPFSGGALLGDRIRMSDSIGDPGVFIRSIASRGSETGLSACANELADVLDAFGSDLIFLETLGVGQLEYKVRFSVHTTLVVLVPEAGDDIQSLKSGLMEIGDIFVVNKADRSHAGRYADDLQGMLKLRHRDGGWCPKVVSTIATRGEGVEPLAETIQEHRAFLRENGGLERKRIEALRNRMIMVAEEKIKEQFWGDPYIIAEVEAVFQQVLNGSKSPYEAARTLAAALTIRREGS
jgi:LAO/AO transport system kinase